MAKTVLVVDDDPTQRRLIQAVLDREGYAVVHAESGGEAIDRLTKGGGADVVLLDLVMPGLSGLETLAEIRTAGVAVPVIVLTANGGIETVVKAMQAGAQDFFVKPLGTDLVRRHRRRQPADAHGQGAGRPRRQVRHPGADHRRERRR
jgi:DNA-binding NtrC family response regulator